MDVMTLLRHQAEMAHQEVLDAIEGVTEAKAWATLPAREDDYLHTDGSVQSLVLHIATGKVLHGSVAFRNTEIRWRDLADRLDTFEPSWEASVAYLREAQEYWMGCWAHVTADDLGTEVLHFRGRLWPIWKVIRMVTHHDSYHAGQIVTSRYMTGESDTPPPSTADDIRNCCQDLPSW